MESRIPSASSLFSEKEKKEKEKRRRPAFSYVIVKIDLSFLASALASEKIFCDNIDTDNETPIVHQDDQVSDLTRGNLVFGSLNLKRSRVSLARWGEEGGRSDRRAIARGRE